MSYFHEKNYQLIEYPNDLENIKVGDDVKISIFFKECIERKTFEIYKNKIENIWTIVEEIDGENITSKINNIMDYQFPNDDSLDFEKRIIYQKNNIKELKRYSVESRKRTVDKITDIILKEFSKEELMELEKMDHTERMKIFEEKLNKIDGC
jgi:hypothetical protein